PTASHTTHPTITGSTPPDDRANIEVRDRRSNATDTGKPVTDLRAEHFPNVMNLAFTRHFEEELDEIETAQKTYRYVLDEFWGPFSKALTEADAKMPAKRGRETGETCPRCGKPLVENFSKKTGRTFVGCSGFREGCKYIKPGEGEVERKEPVET